MSRKVAAPIRAFLQHNHLKDQVKCLVTFWGLPLRINRRRLTDQEKDETERVTKQLIETQAAIASSVASLEQTALHLDPSFQAKTGDDLRQLSRRVDVTLPVIVKAMPALKDPAERTAQYSQMLTAVAQIAWKRSRHAADGAACGGAVCAAPDTKPGRGRRRCTPGRRSNGRSPSLNPNTASAPIGIRLRRWQKTISACSATRFFSRHKESLDADQSESALDSELSLLWWTGYPALVGSQSAGMANAERLARAARSAAAHAHGYAWMGHLSRLSAISFLLQSKSKPRDCTARLRLMLAE